MSDFFNETIERIALAKEQEEKLKILQEIGGFLALKEILIRDFVSSKSSGMLDIFAVLDEDEILELVMQSSNNQLAVASLLELKDIEKIKNVVIKSNWQNISRFAIDMINSVEELQSLKQQLENHQHKEMLQKSIEEKIADIEEFLKRTEAIEVGQVEISSPSVIKQSNDKIEDILNTLEIKTQEDKTEGAKEKKSDEDIKSVESILAKLSLIKSIDQDKRNFIADIEKEFANLQKNIDITKLSVEDIHRLELLRKQIRLGVKFINWQLSIEGKFKEVMSIYEHAELDQYGINQLVDLAEASENIHIEGAEFANLGELEYIDLAGFEILRQKYDETLSKILSSKKENLSIHIQERIDDLQDKIEKGLFSQIDKKINNVEFRLKILDKDIANKFALKLKELKAECLVKKDLHNKAVYPKQEELCKQLETLLANPAASNVEIMKTLSQVSKEWQDLSKGLDKQIYWYRFNEAKKALIERCQVYIRQSSDVRKENSRKRALLVADLLSYVEGLDKDKLVIEELIEKKALFWKSWTAARPFIAEQGTELKDNFKRAMDILEGYLKDFYSQNYNKKVSLINEAKELVSLENHKDAIRKCIKLQLDWKSVGNAGVHETKLWQDFRARCNEVFQNGDQKRENFGEKNNKPIRSEKVENASNQLEKVFKGLDSLFDSGSDRAGLLEKMMVDYPIYKSFFINIKNQIGKSSKAESIDALINVIVILNLDIVEPTLEDKKRELKLKLLTDNHLRNLLPIEKLNKLKENIIEVLAVEDSSFSSLQKELVGSLGKFVYQNSIKLF